MREIPCGEEDTAEAIPDSSFSGIDTDILGVD
jgi:hypothetical protein